MRVHIGKAQALVNLIQKGLGQVMFVFFGQPMQLMGFKALFLGQITFPKPVGTNQFHRFGMALRGQRVKALVLRQFLHPTQQTAT